MVYGVDSRLVMGDHYQSLDFDPLIMESVYETVTSKAGCVISSL